MNPTPVRSRAHSIAGILLGLAITLQLRRYVGINHDSVVYLGQAMLRKWPDTFGHDLFFVHGGSQDHYTLFPLLLGHAMNWIRPTALFLWCELGTLLLFAFAGWYALKALLPRPQGGWAWLGVACLPTAYGKIAMFSYGEQFFTPRPIAELLCLFTIGLLVRRRWLPAAGCLLLAAMFHPLQALAASVVAWFWVPSRDRRWLHALWLGIPVIALALLGIPPFASLLQQLDPEWLFIVRDNNPQLFLTRWNAADLNALALDALVLGYCWRALPGTFGSWCAASLVALGLGLGANLLLVDGLHLVLPAQIQLWRVQWLAHWFAMAGLGVLAYREIHARDWSRLITMTLAITLTWRLANWIWLLPALFYVGWPYLQKATTARMCSLIGALCCIALLVLFADYAGDELVMFRLAHYRLDLYAFDRRLLVFPLLAFALPATGIALWSRAHALGRMALLILLCGLTILGAWRWDLRPPQVLAMEGAAFHERLFGINIPSNAQIMWGYDEPLGAWLVLKRASYFSPHQLSGQIFSRTMAIDGRQRLNRVYPLLYDYRACQAHSQPSGQREQCHISEAALRQTCAPGPNPPPDFIVLPFPQPQPALGHWIIRDPATGAVAETWRLYRCADIMRTSVVRSPSA